MDPYLENPSVWSDFHMTFLVALRPVLSKGLPNGYVVRLDRYVWLDEEADELRLLGKPDAFLVPPTDHVVDEASDIAVVAPLTVTLPLVDHKGKPYLKLIDAQTRRVVTVIELLSPSNKKSGKDRELYLAKREDYLATQTNLVEIDLLRQGLRPPVEEHLAASDYRVIVSRAASYPKAGAWLFSVREPLPSIPIPLKPGEPDVPLSLGECFRSAYELGEYETELDYTRSPEPTLNEADASWARELLANKSV
jgi:hypothetical protein